MKIIVSKELKQLLKNPLYKNALLLILSSLSSASSGFIFWVFAARFYSAEDVGLASAMISAMCLIVLFSLLGFDVVLQRHIPKSEKRGDLINSCFTLSSIFSLCLAVVFLLGIDFWLPSLGILKSNSMLFILFILFSVTVVLFTLLGEGVFVGFRRTEYSFFLTIVSLGRLLVIPFLVSLGAVGIFAAYGSTDALASIFGIFLITKLEKKYRPALKIRKEVVNDIFHFSSGNYFARIFEYLPTFVLPLIVVNLLGVEMNAYFYIAWAFSMLFTAVPRFTSMSLLVEGSHAPEDLRRNTVKAIKFIFLILIPAIVLVYAFGKYILLIFGEMYAKNSLDVLLILVLGAIPFSVNSVYASIKRVEGKVGSVVWTYGGIAFLTLAGAYVLIPIFGLIGVGIAWVLGNTIVAGIVALTMIKKEV